MMTLLQPYSIINTTHSLKCKVKMSYLMRFVSLT